MARACGLLLHVGRHVCSADREASRHRAPGQPRAEQTVAVKVPATSLPSPTSFNPPVIVSPGVSLHVSKRSDPVVAG